MNVPAWPLHWPPGWKRSEYRTRAPFRVGVTKGRSGERLTIQDALRRLLPELEKLGADDVTISTNVKPHLYNQVGDSQDPGAAVYFSLDGRPTVLACDRWDRTADNLAAVAAHVEALRGQDRWGVGTIAQAVAGYQALPPVPSSSRAWWDVLMLPPTANVEEIADRRRKLLEALHPDRAGGDGARAAEVNQAYQEGMKDRRSS